MREVDAGDAGPKENDWLRKIGIVMRRTVAMGKIAIQTAHAPLPAGAYSQGLCWGNLLFTAGMGPIDPQSQKIKGTTIEEQTRQVFNNLLAVLAVQGLTAHHILKVTAHLQHLTRDFAGFDHVYREFFEAPYPVRTTVGSQLNHILVEVDVVAYIPYED